MNHAEITSLALSYADRSDSEVTSRINDFILIVEARVNRFLKVRQMSVRTTIITALNQEYYGLPNDFAGIRDIEVSDPSTGLNRITLLYLNPEQMNNKVRNSQMDNEFATGTPQETQIYYTIIANQLQIYPTQDSKTLELVYFQHLPVLANTTPNNWLADLAPDAYVFGILTEISAFVKDAEAAQLWNTRFMGVLDGLAVNDQDERWSGTPLQIRLG